MNLLEASPYRAETIQIVQDVFSLMLGYTAEPSGQDEGPPGGDRIVASVFFEGAWKGAVVLECSEVTARKLCAHLMKIPVPDEMDADARDAVGELINMVGGNLKAVLPCGVVLSPPNVTHTSGPSHEIGLRTLKKVFGFTCEAGPFWLTLFE